jgi:hypothetical protein
LRRTHSSSSARECGSARRRVARPIERGGIGLALGHRKAAHAHAAHPVGPFGVLVLPRPRVARARGQHVDVVTVADVLGEQPAGVLGAGGEVGAVTGA